KILIVFDGKHFSEGALNFACRLADESPVSITGLFLKQSDFVPVWDPGPLPGIGFLPYETENDGVEASITRFREACLNRNLPFRLHHSAQVTNLPDLMKLSRFYDAIIVGNECFFKNINKQQPNSYLKDLLHAAECPVFVIPEKAALPENIVLAYDGSKSSVFAIRQFVLLFPEFCEKKALLVYEGNRFDNIP